MIIFYIFTEYSTSNKRSESGLIWIYGFDQLVSHIKNAVLVFSASIQLKAAFWIKTDLLQYFFFFFEH